MLSSRHTESEFSLLSLNSNNFDLLGLSEFIASSLLSCILNEVFGPDKDIEEKKAEALWYLVLITWLN